ncbi:MAG: Mitochondrial presequence protease [Sarcosagium campestre]|nr:MAG: Mitochondrial presequence protease [Sarcosagium campestre]
MLRLTRKCLGRTRHIPCSQHPRPTQRARRSYVSVTSLDNLPKPGEQLHGFTLKRRKHVPELELTALQFQHDKTGADYLHVAREDKNNVFSIAFKTNPPNDTGVPHILEHTTLCGSERYPIRDPFFKMLPRSLSNFMNAFTSSDHTSYPFATTNQQDFKNLMSVYLDATLHPLLDANDFNQEGWRIGPENPTPMPSKGSKADMEGKLVFKGVVYNEMKGQMSDASYLYYIRFQDHIFPAIHNSGGDPQAMTELTHDQLKKFHSANYHPSNSKIFSYGNFPVESHLIEVGARLQNFDQSGRDAEIKEPVRMDNGPLQVTIGGPIDPLVDKDMQYKTSTSWLMADSSDVLETFSLSLMSTLLLDGYGSPLYRSLIEAGIGPDFSPNTGFDASSRRSIFSVGLTGVKVEDVPKVKEIIEKTLRDVHLQGFDGSKVDGILHRLELGLKHKTANFGMGLMQRLQPGWFNGVDPFDALAWEKTISDFKAKMAQGHYLEDLLEKYLLNDRSLTFTMEPSATYGDELAREESARLSAKIEHHVAQVGDKTAALKQLVEREQQLLSVQQKAQDQDLSCLPTVHVKDIPRQADRKETRDSKIDAVSLQWREAPTNGLTYFRAINTLENLPDELRQFIPLFTDSIMRLDTRHQTVEQIEDLIKLKTGGIGASYHSSTSPHDFSVCHEGLSFSGFALDRNVSAMYDLLNTVVLETDFDSPEAEGRIRELLQGSASGAISSIAESGHAYARRVAHAGLTPEGRLTEQLSGLTQVKLVAELASRPAEQGLADVIEKLKAIQKFAFSNSSSMRVALTCGAESTQANEAELQRFLSSMPPATRPISSNLASKSFTSINAKTFFPLPYQVYYGALALPTVPFTHPDGPSLQILAQLLTHKHLHHEIREKGGAYGGGAYSSGLGGVFGFYSYRDPNPQNSLSIMQSAGRWGRDRDWTDRDLEEAKLSVFQGLDAPESVSAEGMKRFITGISDDMAQQRRERLLDVSAPAVKAVAQKYLVDGFDDRANVAFLGEKKPWVREADGWSFQDLGMSDSPAIDTSGNQ